MCSMASRRASGARRMELPSPIVGMGGKSSASIPLMVASFRAATIWACRDRGATVSATSTGGREAMNSVNRRAGMVMAPSSSTVAGIQAVIAISRLVAASLRRPSSVVTKTCEVCGKVLRVATARPTVFSPRCRSSCWVVSFTTHSFATNDQLDTQLCTDCRASRCLPNVGTHRVRAA